MPVWDPRARDAIGRFVTETDRWNFPELTYDEARSICLFPALLVRIRVHVGRTSVQSRSARSFRQRTSHVLSISKSNVCLPFCVGW